MTYLSNAIRNWIGTKAKASYIDSNKKDLQEYFLKVKSLKQ